ncbi:hypothetical protein DFH09DRAFT_1219112 [Mycena vulgaris]|nr:hypothetical protein DFH09DRAFT_1219112 [Mycena vulgaris]
MRSIPEILSPPSPISRLPSELLAEIFALCWLSFWPPFEDIAGLTTASFETEIGRLAHLPLLTLSRVCSRWHTIVLGTPALWREIQLDNVLWDTSSNIENVLGLIKSALERSGNSSLIVAIVSDVGKPPFYPALELLSAHSERWQTVGLRCPLSVIYALSGIHGKLSRLENLELELWDDEPAVLDILEVVPKLTRFAFGGPPTAIAKLPLGQLASFSWLGMLSLDAPMVMSVMPHLKPSAEFRFALELWSEEISPDCHLNIPPITADVSRLTLEVIETFRPAHCKHALGEIFANLTLPALKELNLRSEQHPCLPLPWPHSDFLALSARSSFHTHLQFLDLHHAILTETELIECLSTLPSLERLAVSDHQRVGDQGVDQILFTDTLLTALTLSSDKSPIVPGLRRLFCISVLQFDDHVFLKFLLSRSAHRAGDAMGPFKIHTLAPPGHHQRPFDPDVVGQLCSQKDLVFEVGLPPTEHVLARSIP